MINIHEERIQWVKDLFNIELHYGQKNTLLAKQYPLQRKGIIRIECHDRRWGKTLIICLDALTYYLAYPQSKQLITTINFMMSRHVENEILRFIKKIQNNADAIQRWPFIENIKHSNGIISSINDNCGNVQIVDINIKDKYCFNHNSFDRVLIDDANYISNTNTLSHFISCRKTDGELLLMSTIDNQRT